MKPDFTVKHRRPRYQSHPVEMANNQFSAVAVASVGSREQVRQMICDSSYQDKTYYD
jgi:hypothetical protein